MPSIFPPLSRAAFDPRDVVPAADFATSISADRPIVAERAYATSGDGLYGVLGHTASPPRTDSRAWYFAEGNTSSQIETFFVLFNLSTRPAQVRGTYFVDAATAREQSLTVPAGGRLAVRANEIVPAGVFSARFQADQNIMVERTLYFAGRLRLHDRRLGRREPLNRCRHPFPPAIGSPFDEREWERGHPGRFR